ncbi:MAG: hypothetical protein LBH44_07420 [Treponema sp.]|jgi:hypothetical protein|nr:hypothetical protein [Treponema sp.]
MKQKLSVWGREFDLDVEFDCYTGKEKQPYQEDAFKAFLSCSNLVDDSLDEVKKYCIDRDEEKTGDVIENIFKYVIPQSLFIRRNSKSDHVVALMCAYKFDEEHGIAVVFKNEQLDEVTDQGSVL